MTVVRLRTGRVRVVHCPVEASLLAAAVGECGGDALRACVLLGELADSVMGLPEEITVGRAMSAAAALRRPWRGITARQILENAIERREYLSRRERPQP